MLGRKTARKIAHKVAGEPIRKVADLAVAALIVSCLAFILVLMAVAA